MNNHPSPCKVIITCWNGIGDCCIIVVKQTKTKQLYHADRHTRYLQAAKRRDETHSIRVADAVSHGAGVLDIGKELCHDSGGGTHSESVPVAAHFMASVKRKKKRRKSRLLTKLLRPFDGGARVCGVALCQVNHLGADLPAHHRIQSCREEERPLVGLSAQCKLPPATESLMIFTLYLPETCVVCCRCWCSWRCPFPWWSSRLRCRRGTLQTSPPAGPPPKGRRSNGNIQRPSRAKLKSPSIFI